MLQKGGVVITGVFFGLALLTFLAALSMGEVSRVTPISESSIVLVLVGGMFFLGEKDRLFQKVAGSLLILVGIILLSI
jgi:uncharacterized membrane protein